jgi:hypothetical protein
MQRLTALLLIVCLACFTVGCGGKTGKTPAGDSGKTPPADNQDKTKTPVPQDC